MPVKKGERIYVWRYLLRSRTALNAKSARREFAGALLRIGGGYGCLHPWPEFGDLELETLLSELKNGATQEPAIARAMEMARLDVEYRAAERSLFENLAVPDSHATITELRPEAIEEAVLRGYSVMKVKGHRDYAALAMRIGELSRRWPALRWRIDFNDGLTRESVLRFAQCLTDHAAERIDFLEDPCSYSPDDWREIRKVTGLDLAMDRPAEFVNPEAQVLVLKPAREDVSRYLDRKQRLVVTSNMDHALGQCYAAVEAARLAAGNSEVDQCGLQTHGLFETDQFSERLGSGGPRFHPPGGHGLGFDDLLENLPWKRLS